MGALRRTHAFAHAYRETGQTVRMILPFEFTIPGWSKSLPPVFFVLTSSGRFDIGKSQNLASCSTTAVFTIQIYLISVNSNLPNITVRSFEFIGQGSPCHCSHLLLKM